MFRFSAGPVSTGNNSAIQVVAVSCLVFLYMISAGCGGSASPFVKGLVSQQKNKFEQTLRSTISLPDSLPDAIVGRLYSAVLEPQGSHAPYHFLLLAGELPDGLSMDSSNGRISGRPLVPGDYELLIRVASKRERAQGLGHVKLQVAKTNSAQTLAVHISPTSLTLTSGGSQQFTASVTHATNNSVVWSASAGAISGTGLYVAPTVTANTNATVTVTSVQDSSKSAVAKVLITPAAITPPAVLTLNTTTLPNATVGANYGAQLSASGGVAPYAWHVVGGSLPQGISLDSASGALSGSPASAGSFSFAAQVSDSSSQSSQQQLTLTVQSNVVNNSCGPPTYSCARTDLNPAPTPSKVPDAGNLLGMNRITTDPDFNSRIVRITDASLNTGIRNLTFEAGFGGSADANVWNTDSSLLYVQDVYGWMYPLSFDASAMQVSRLYAQSFPQWGGMRISAGGSWSRSDPNVLYSFETRTPSISRYDFTDRSSPPQPSSLVDFSSAANCLPLGFKPIWRGIGGVSRGDTVFVAAYSNTGTQGSGVYVAAYKIGSGCTVYNTQTGSVSGNWGSTGIVNTPDRYTIHNVKISKDGNWVVIVGTTCFSTNCDGPYFWQIGTTNVVTCQQGCSGHWTEGNLTWVNNNGSPKIGQYQKRPFSNASLMQTVITNLPSTLQIPFDQHPSWNNADDNDSNPFLTSTYKSTTSTWAPWYNEILAISPSAGTVSRFAHTFATVASHRFSTKYAIGSVSQDGRFFVFSSDWMGTLGSESGSTTCTVGTDCRGDAFVVELK